MSLNRMHICGTSSGFALVLESHLAVLDALEVLYACYREVEVLPPPAYYRIPVYYLVALLLEESWRTSSRTRRIRSFLACLYEVNRVRGPGRRTVPLRVGGPEVLAAQPAFLPLESLLLEQSSLRNTSSASLKIPPQLSLLSIIAPFGSTTPCIPFRRTRSGCISISPLSGTGIVSSRSPLQYFITYFIMSCISCFAVLELVQLYLLAGELVYVPYAEHVAYLPIPLNSEEAPLQWS